LRSFSLIPNPPLLLFAALPLFLFEEVCVDVSGQHRESIKGVWRAYKEIACSNREDTITTTTVQPTTARRLHLI